MKRILVFCTVVVITILLLGCPKEKYSGEYIPSTISGPVDTYNATLVAKLSAYDEEKKLYYATFRPIPLKYPYEKIFVIKDIRNLKTIYESLRDYMPSAVKEDTIFIKVGEEVKDYSFLHNKSAILFTLGEKQYRVDYKAEATNINHKIYVTITYSTRPADTKNYPYILVLFDNPVKEDIEVKINKQN